MSFFSPGEIGWRLRVDRRADCAAKKLLVQAAYLEKGSSNKKVSAAQSKELET